MAGKYLFIEECGGLLARGAAAAGEDLAGLRVQTGAIQALTRLERAGYRLVVLVDPRDPRTRAGSELRARLESFVDALFDSQQIRFEARQTCPHGAAADCDCALPGIGLVAAYVADADLDRARSAVVGDRDETRGIARAMGIQGFTLAPSMSWEDVAHTLLDRPRRSRVRRRTRETEIEVDVDLDRVTEPEVDTGIGFFDHMLEQLGKHGGFALRVQCRGDLEVDEHHTIEDVALALGQALREALGDKRGIGRYGFLLPMDEAEARVAIDLSGRAYAVFEGEFPRENVGGMPTELVGHFFRSLSDTLGAALHVSVRGDNAHHMVEASFKGVARALRQAFARSGTDLPSTKGSL